MPSIAFSKNSFSKASWGTANFNESVAPSPIAQEPAVNSDHRCTSRRSFIERFPEDVGIVGNGAMTSSHDGSSSGYCSVDGEASLDVLALYELEGDDEILGFEGLGVYEQERFRLVQ